MIKFLKRQDLPAKIEAQNGRFFTIAFQKVDGSPRKMNGRTGVIKNCGGRKKLKGHKNLLSVYDVKNNGYRYANVDTTMALNAEHFTFIIID